MTLAAVLGTNCLIDAGARAAPMPQASASQLDSASSTVYVVGGSAAVPEAKLSGRTFTRVSGADRWATARRVGSIASGSAPPDVDEFTADTDCPAEPWVQGVSSILTSASTASLVPSEDTDLRCADFTHHDFASISRNDHTVRHGWVLRNADLRQANFTNALIRSFEGSDLRGALLMYTRTQQLRNTDLRNAVLTRARLFGADLRGAKLNDATLRYAELNGANLMAVEMLDSDLREAQLCRADLRFAKLRHADLRRARLDWRCQRYLPYSGDNDAADLSDADLRDADLREANLRGTDLRNADLRNADLRGAHLGGEPRDEASHSDLSDADLRGADLRDADLRSSSLIDADLRGADLRGADLRGADLRHAALDGANFTDATTEGCRGCP